MADREWQRPKSWVVRRLVEYPEGTKYEFLRMKDEPPDKVDDQGEWVELHEDATMFFDRTIAQGLRDNWALMWNCNLNVVSHAVVER